MKTFIALLLVLAVRLEAATFYPNTFNDPIYAEQGIIFSLTWQIKWDTNRQGMLVVNNDIGKAPMYFQFDYVVITNLYLTNLSGSGPYLVADETTGFVRRTNVNVTVYGSNIVGAVQAALVAAGGGALSNQIFNLTALSNFLNQTLQNLSGTGAFTNRLAADNWQTFLVTNSGIVSVISSNPVTTIASNATTGLLSFSSVDGTPVYEVTNLNANFTVYLTNLVAGRDIWLYVRTDGTPRTITISTNLLPSAPRLTFGLASVTNGIPTATATNRMRWNFKAGPVGEISTAFEYQQ